MLLLSTAINMRREEEGRGGKGRGGKGRTKEGKREGKGRERERETYTGKKFLVISIAGAARWKLNSVTIGGVAGVAGRVEEGAEEGEGEEEEEASVCLEVLSVFAFLLLGSFVSCFVSFASLLILFVFVFLFSGSFVFTFLSSPFSLSLSKPRFLPVLLVFED